MDCKQNGSITELLVIAELMKYGIVSASDYKLDSILNKINIAEQTGGGSSTVS